MSTAASGNLHGICHSNHLQMTEDQVIQNVVAAMNTDPDGTVEKPEILIFIADLMGMQLGGGMLGNMTDEELLHVAEGLRIEKHAFTHAWHQRFHDSIPFIQATFDAFDINRDGFMDGAEIEGIITMALQTSGQFTDITGLLL